MVANYIMRNHGFTLIEISIVLAVTALLFSLAMISLTRVQTNTYVGSSVQSLLSDIKLQQTNAMNGRLGQGGTTTQYGVHFETNSYTLFEGGTFDELDPANFTVTLQGSTEFSFVTFPSNKIVFEKGSGEIAGFVEENNTIVLQDVGSGIQTQIELNALGVFTKIQ
jgi:prepilin-type N-terminal cleavage/methylation domain-containing protein